MVLSLPVTPEPAVAGPLTGGQIAAHEPLQFDFVLVSGTNQYKVKPLAFVSTVIPPTLAVFRVLAVDAGAPECVELPELAGADDRLARAISSSSRSPRLVAWIPLIPRSRTV
jgi:hypothetical protein